MSNKWIFIVDTDSYAGNFERDMCAYITGVIGDCGVGEEFAELYRKEVPKSPDFGSYIEQRADDHGCYRPTKCWPTKGWLSVGYDKAVRKEDWNQAEADAAVQKETAEIYRGYYNQVKLVTIGSNGWTEENKAKELKRHQKDIDKALKTKATKSEPNNSVAIFFEKRPTSEMITLMKERAAKFAEAKRSITKNSWDKNFKLKIVGFRLVKETTKSEEEDINV